VIHRVWTILIICAFTGFSYVSAQESESPEDGRFYYSHGVSSIAVDGYGRYTGRQRKPFIKEEHTKGTLSLEELARTFSMKIDYDSVLDLYTLSNDKDKLVFVPNMGRFEVNGISLVLPIRPYYQGDRLYIPVEVVTFLRTPLPEYDKVPQVIRRALKHSRVELASVFIDAGHGGHDPGAISSRGIKEKDINLDIALRMQKILKGQGVNVAMSRSSDFFVELPERVNLASQSGADVFVSIHSNMCSDSSVSGVETFYVSRKKASEILADTIQNTLAQNLGVPDRGIKERSLAVLRNNPLPSVLVEVGFLSNRDNEALLGQAFYREKIASLIVEAIAEYSLRCGRGR